MEKHLLVKECRLVPEHPAHANSFLLSLQAAVETAGRQVTYTHLAGISGAAFRPVTWEYDEYHQWHVFAHQMPFVGRALGLKWHLLWPNHETFASIQHVSSMQTSERATLLLPRAVTKMTWNEETEKKVLAYLQEGIPVMVCGGWPGADGQVWGLIVGYRSGIFYGWHTRSRTLEPLTESPRIALAIAGLQKPYLSAGEIFRQSLQRAAVESGHSDVYDKWADFLLISDDRLHDKENWMCHLRLATLTRDARMAALGFLGKQRDHVPVSSLLHLDDLDFRYSEVTRVLRRDIDHFYVRPAFACPVERAEMAERVLVVKRHEHQSAATLRRLADTIAN